MTILNYKSYIRLILAICFMVDSGYTMESESDKANRFYKAGYLIVDELKEGSKTIYDSKIYNPRAIEKLKCAEENFQNALELGHPYAAMALRDVYGNAHMRKTKTEGKLEEALLKSIHYKNKNYIRAGYLQDVDMLMWGLKKIDPQTYSLQGKKVLSKCSNQETDYLGGLQYMESVCPERAIAVYGKLASQPENEHSDTALDALYRLSTTCPSSFAELSFACFNRENDEDGLFWLEKAMEIGKGTDRYNEWLVNCVWYDKERDYYGKFLEPLTKDACLEILVKKRDTKETPLFVRLRSARLINDHDNSFKNNLSYLQLLVEFRKYQVCQFEIDRITLHILRQSETNGEILCQYAPIFKNQLIDECNMDPNSLVWNANKDNFVEAYHLATECFDTLDEKLKMNIGMCLDLYMRAVKLRFGKHRIINEIMNTPILLVHNLSNFALFLAKESPSSLPALSEYTHNPVFSCIASLVGWPKLSQYDVSVMRGWEAVEHVDALSKTVKEYAPQYDVTLYDNEFLLNTDLPTNKKLEYHEISSRKALVSATHKKRDQLIDSLTPEEQFDLAMEYELMSSCLNACNKPLKSIQGSYLNCLWLSASRGYSPAIRELAYLYTKGDKKHFVQMYFLTKEMSPHSDIRPIIMRNQLLLDWKDARSSRS